MADPEQKAKELQQKMKPEDKALAKEALEETDPKVRDKMYNQYVKKATPKRSMLGRIARA